MPHSRRRVCWSDSGKATTSTLTTTLGYNTLVDTFKDSAIPVFFSEYGCNKPAGVPRVFNEVGSLYGQEMTVLSGGLVYEYSQEPSDYGLVIINDNSTVSLRQDFDNLQSQYNKLDINLIQSAEAAKTNQPFPQCSGDDISNPGFSKNFTIPDVPEGAQELIDNGIKNPVNGKIIKVSATAVPMPVYASNGNAISNLAIKPLAEDQTNVPGGENTSGDSTSAPKPTSTKKGSAAQDTVNRNLLFVVGLAGLLVL